MKSSISSCCKATKTTSIHLYKRVTRWSYCFSFHWHKPCSICKYLQWQPQSALHCTSHLLLSKWTSKRHGGPAIPRATGTGLCPRARPSQIPQGQRQTVSVKPMAAPRAVHCTCHALLPKWTSKGHGGVTIPRSTATCKSLPSALEAHPRTCRATFGTNTN